MDDGSRAIEWDGVAMGGRAKELESATALINLAGRSVNCRYPARNRWLIMDSRINSTRARRQAMGMTRETGDRFLGGGP
jgi:uncharacterized protein